MVEKTIKEIKKSGDIILYTDKIELNDGTSREFIILSHKHTQDFMKNEKGQNMYNVTYETREWYPKETFKNLAEIFKI